MQNIEVADYLTDSNHSAIHWSAAYGANSCLLVMVQHSGNIHQLDAHGRTPMHFAAYNNHFSTIKLLHSLKGQIDFPDNEGATPLHYAIKGKFVHLLSICMLLIQFCRRPFEMCQTYLGHRS